MSGQEIDTDPYIIDTDPYIIAAFFIQQNEGEIVLDTLICKLEEYRQTWTPSKAAPGGVELIESLKNLKTLTVSEEKGLSPEETVQAQQYTIIAFSRTPREKQEGGIVLEPKLEGHKTPVLHITEEATRTILETYFWEDQIAYVATGKDPYKFQTRQQYIPKGNIPTIKKPPFAMRKEGDALNELAQVRPKKATKVEDDITGITTFIQGNVLMSLPTFLAGDGMKTSTFQLLDALLIQADKEGYKQETSITLDEYQQARDLKSEDKTFRQAKKDIELLLNGAITFTRARRGRAFAGLNILSSAKVGAGLISVSFTPDFLDMLNEYPSVPYALALLSLDNKRYPNAYNLGRRLSTHKTLNIGKPNEDIISVKTLLDACPYIPSYKQAQQRDRHIEQDMIKPLERDLDALSEVLTWEYCNKGGEPLTDEQLTHINDWSTWSRLLVRVSWINYPAQEERRAAIAARAERARKKRAKGQQTTPKKRGRPRKQPPAPESKNP